MNFLTSWWLLGLGTFLLPILLHLWRQPKLTRIKIGSVRFVPTDCQPPRRAWRWRELLLLFLRLLVLTLLFGWLAGPIVWPKQQEVAGKWLLVDPAQWPLRADAEPAKELLRQGFAARVLPASADLWSQLAEADATLSSSSRLAVLIAPQVKNLQGSRTALRHHVEWLQGKLPEPERWTARMQKGQIATGLTTPERTSYQWQPDAAADHSPQTVKILLVANPDQAAEADLLTTALQTALEISGGLADIRRSEKMEHADLLICLSEQKNFPPDAKAILTLANPRDLRPVVSETVRQISREPLPGRTIWKTSGGEPLLTLAEKSDQRVYHFGSRFLPAASDLGTSGLLVDWLIRDFLPTTPSVEKDRRTVSLAEAQEQFSPSSGHRPPLQPRSWQLFFWLLLAAAFLAERLVSRARSRFAR